MTVFASPGHEARFAKQLNDDSRCSARRLRVCNLLVWCAGSAALLLDTSSVDSLKEQRLLQVNLAAIGVFALVELCAYRMLRQERRWERNERLKAVADILILAGVMTGHLLRPRDTRKLVYRTYFCAGSRTWLVLPDQLRLHTAWKVHLCGLVAFAIMQGDTATRQRHQLPQLIFEVSIYLVSALFPVLIFTFASEMRARQSFAARHRMLPEEVGTFWSGSFQLDAYLPSAAKLQPVSWSLHRREHAA